MCNYCQSDMMLHMYGTTWCLLQSAEEAQPNFKRCETRFRKKCLDPGMARMFFHKPTFGIMDECTSAVSVDAEEQLYQSAHDCGITAITVSQRLGLERFHGHELRFGCNNAGMEPARHRGARGRRRRRGWSSGASGLAQGSSKLRRPLVIPVCLCEMLIALLQ